MLLFAGISCLQAVVAINPFQPQYLLEVFFHAADCSVMFGTFSLQKKDELIFLGKQGV